MEHYVYALLDPRKPGNYEYPYNGEFIVFLHEPFYIGKGKGKRINDHVRDAEANKNPSNHKENRIRSILSDGYRPVEVKLRVGLSDIESINAEIAIIAAVGRRADDSGPLTNISLGGDGMAGVPKSMEHRASLSKPKTEEHKAKLRAANLGKTHTQATRDKLSMIGKGRPHSEAHSGKIAEALRGKKKSDEHRASLSEAKKGKTPSAKCLEASRIAHTGRKHSEESKEKRRQKLLGVKRPIVDCPHCGKKGAQNIMARWHFDNCRDKK